MKKEIIIMEKLDVEEMESVVGGTGDIRSAATAWEARATDTNG